MISETQKQLLITITGDRIFNYIRDKTSIEISKLKSISDDEQCCKCERRALKDDSLSVFIIIFDDHNTKKILNSSW